MALETVPKTDTKLRNEAPTRQKSKLPRMRRGGTCLQAAAAHKTKRGNACAQIEQREGGGRAVEGCNATRLVLLASSYPCLHVSVQSANCPPDHQPKPQSQRHSACPSKGARAIARRHQDAVTSMGHRPATAVCRNPRHPAVGPAQYQAAAILSTPVGRKGAQHHPRCSGGPSQHPS